MSSTLNNNLFSILNMKLLSERVQFVLKDAKIDQTQLGDHAGASRSVVSQWLDGKIKSMSLKYALDIERNLGYNHIWLMINEGDKKTTGNKTSAGVRIDSVAANSDAVTASDLVRLVNAFSSADATQRSIILAAVTAAERATRKNAAAGGN